MRNRLIRGLSVSLTASLLLGGCGSAAANTGVETAVTAASSAETETSAAAETSASTAVSADTDYFSNRDLKADYDESESIAITFDGDSASCASDTVSISGTTVTITDEGTYLLSGTLDDGMVIVDAEKTDKIQLVLNNVSINSETSAAIYVLQADKVFLTTAEGTENTLSNGGTFTAIDENNIDAAVFSKEDLTMNGLGSLTIASPAGHGVVSKDSLRVTSGSYEINCSSHALNGKDEVCIANAAFTIAAGKDGIHAENDDDASCGYVYIQSGTFDITAEGDGISAGAYLLVEDGDFTVTAGGGSANAEKQSSDSWGQFMGGRHGGMMGGTSSQTTTTETDEESTSMKGIKATTALQINGGTFTIDSADDSVHSNDSITVNGGTFTIASGDDGFHADDTLTVNDGTISISESYEGLEGLHVVINGGDITLVASDDGLNAAGGTDSSGTTGGRDGMFGGGRMGSSSSNGTILISGGTIHITASGDGIDANGTLEITGGYTVVSGPTQGDTSTLDYDVSGVITGGTFIGTGASSMAQTFSSSEQGVISVNVGNTSAGTTLTLSDSDGNTLLTYTPDLAYEIVILSSPDIVSGETYTVTVGSSSGEITAT